MSNFLDPSYLLNWVNVHSGHLSTLFRGVWRISTAIPEDRKADYAARDYASVLLTAVLMEGGYRLARQFYGFPYIDKVLGIGPQVTAADHPLHTYRIQNQVELRDKLVGSVIKSDSTYTVPHLLNRQYQQEAEQLRKAVSKASGTSKNKLQAELQALEEKQQTLIPHLLKRFDYGNYVMTAPVKSGALSEAEALLVQQAHQGLAKFGFHNSLQSFHAAMEQLRDALTLETEDRAKTVQQALKTFEHQLSRPEKTIQPALKKCVENALGSPTVSGKGSEIKAGWSTEVHEHLKSLGEQTEKTLRDGLNQLKKQVGSVEGLTNTLDRVEKQLATGFFEAATRIKPDNFPEALLKQNTSKLGNRLEPVVEHVLEGFQQERLVGRLSYLKKNLTWAEIALATGLFLVGTGVAFSWLDNAVIQPWQSRAVARYGNVNGVPEAMYLGTLTGGAAYLGLMNVAKVNQFLDKHLGYAGKFMAASTVGMGVFTLSTVALSAWFLNRKQPHPPGLATETPALSNNEASAFGRSAPRLDQLQVSPLTAVTISSPMANAFNAPATPAAVAYPPVYSGSWPSASPWSKIG
ncbi:MAG: hypothetical protein SFZ03_01790 [Candidatus Melainabacteria bacterium]|nr:hypothetical protein [Candidatus Melainabacteria bacterium]